MQLLDKAEITNIYGVFEGQVNHIDTKLYVKIPHYQRPYKWRPEEINRLFDDYYRNKELSGDANYFIGALVTVKEDDKEFHDVIDGQQRITTTFLINYMRFLLLRAYAYEEILSGRTGKTVSLLNEIKKCYFPCLGKMKMQELEILCDEIGRKVDEKDDACNDTEREIINREIQEAFEKGLKLPTSNFTNKEDYFVESSKCISEFLNVDFLNVKIALSYDRKQYNKNLLRALSSVCVIYSQANEPELYVAPKAILDESIKTYVIALKSIFNNMCEHIQKKDSTNEPRKMCRQLIDLAKEIINSLKFCIVSTCRYEDAYTLFEVLNDRALAIEDVDLVKNLLFRTYCLTDKVDDELQKDSNIQEIDDIWGNDIFSNLSATQSKLIQYLSTCFLTADTSLIYKEDIKFRKPLQTYLELNYNESCQYSYVKLFNDVAVYRMIKIITDKLGLLYNNSVLPALKAEWSDEKSITYKCLHLIYALDMKGVLAALTNLILREYFDSHVNNNSIVNFDDFAKYVVLLFEDKKHTNTDFSNIHKTAYSLWRACLLSDTANTPRQLAKKFIEKVNKTNKLESAIDFSINEEITQEFIKWTEGWRYNQNKQRNLKARIMLINLCKTEKNESTSMLEYTPGHFTITDWDSVQLDHLEAQKPDVNHISEYFIPQRDGDPRDNYTDCLGNMMLLDGNDNNNKNNLPLCKAMGYYQHMGTHWLITEIDEMINSDKYSIEINGNRVPNEEFFNERRKRLQKYFYSILQFKLSDKEGKIKDPN